MIGFTDTVNRGKKLLFASVVDKLPEHYERKYCHINMHRSNYVISAYHYGKPELLDRLRAKDPMAIEEVRQVAIESGLKGEVIVKEPLGGPGKKRITETKEQWLAKRRSGMPELVRFYID